MFSGGVYKERPSRIFNRNYNQSAEDGRGKGLEKNLCKLLAHLNPRPWWPQKIKQNWPANLSRPAVIYLGSNQKLTLRTRIGGFDSALFHEDFFITFSHQGAIEEVVKLGVC